MVTVKGSTSDNTTIVNQRQPALKKRTPNALGVFHFEANSTATIIVSNENADGYVVVDGLQIVPIEIAIQERAGKRESGYSDIDLSAHPVLSQPKVAIPNTTLQ